MFVDATTCDITFFWDNFFESILLLNPGISGGFQHCLLGQFYIGLKCGLMKDERGTCGLCLSNFLFFHFAVVRRSVLLHILWEDEIDKIDF